MFFVICIDYIVLLLIKVAHQMMWKKMYDERICVAILLFYFHNRVFTITDSQLNLAL